MTHKQRFGEWCCCRELLKLGYRVRAGVRNVEKAQGLLQVPHRPTSSFFPIDACQDAHECTHTNFIL